MNVREAIQSGPMNRFQIGVVIICLLTCIIDGFEVLAMGYVAPALAKAWSLNHVQVGYVLSAGIFGMAMGATFLSPLADKLGRRRHVLVCLMLIVIGMAASAVASNLTWLLIARSFAGLFLGAIIASLNVTVAEYCSDRKRATVMGIYGIGFPLGAAIGGFMSIYLIGSFGWRGPLWFGACLTFVMFLGALVLLPESINFLVEKRPVGALKTYNKIGAKLGLPPANDLPPQTHYEVQATVSQSVFQGIMLKRTLLLWFGHALLLYSFYFANMWTPKLLADATGIPMLGVRVGALVAAGGVFGALIFSVLSLRMHPRVATCFIMCCGLLVFVLFGSLFRSGIPAFVVAVLVGMCANGGVAAFYAISPPIYPTAVRGAAVGWMMGFGRATSFITPIVTGYILSVGVTPQAMYMGFGVVMAVGGLCILSLHNSYKGIHALDAMQQEAKCAAARS